MSAKEVRQSQFVYGIASLHYRLQHRPLHGSDHSPHTSANTADFMWTARQGIALIAGGRQTTMTEITEFKVHKKNESLDDLVNHPKHYELPNGIEVFDVILE